jgi:hypothetical protein
MRALRRHLLAALIMAVAGFAATPANAFAGSSAGLSAAAAAQHLATACPEGTNWDNVKHACV